jgi:hypothetical protein
LIVIAVTDTARQPRGDDGRGACAKKCVTDTLARWRGQLGGVDVFVLANCTAMQNGLRAADLP